ncbi:prolyl oligopeptidase family serine peptidase [Pelomonas sp. SE-A7]|uniref:alpha/beta hydrolase family protein n=1 Tax=Pelomonas sp. SE-A7 TaxID=3054953 RepID=UPI00259C799B|nr:prolyl oligopeptidase family serine peptidase [Pelomonas sp. SE-A7]MDM4767309.1 prolyl oligopeptidase family serine peptidase [Pelomonas sp. SE-A7]
MKTMTIVRLLWTLLCLAGLPVQAQQAPAAAEPSARRAALPNASVFFRGPELYEAKLSPSGRMLAITTRRSGVRVGLFLIDLAQGSKPNRLAQFKDVDIWNIHWVNDERLLFSAVDYSRGSGSPEGAPGLFAIDTGNGEITELVQRETPIVSEGSIRRRVLDLNHQLLWAPESAADADGEQVLIAKLRDGGSGMSPFLSPLWLNIRTGRSQRGDLELPGGTRQLLTDSRGQPRLATTLDGRRQKLHWRGPQDKGWRVLAEGDLLDMPFTPRWVDDQGQLFVQSRDSSGLLVFGLYDFARNRPAEPLVRVEGFDFEGQVVAEQGRVLGIRVEHDAETTVWFEPALKAIQAAVDKRLPGKVNRLSCRRCDQPDAVVLVRSYSDQDPGRLWVYRPQAAEGQPAWLPLGTLMPGVDPARMAQREFQRIKARDGRDLPVWITRPAGLPAGQAAPAVVLVHGGPWVRHGRWQWDPMSQFLASRGYLVIEPEFRGSTGYGEAHFKAGWKQWGQAMQDDVADALLWARQQKLADDRACIAGASYGGYSALMGLARHGDLYRCGIAWVAVTDLKLLVEGSWWIRDDAGALARRYSIPEMIGDAKADAAMLAANSPVLLADRIKAPVLLAFGEADLRVPLAHGKRMREALTAAGNEPQWVVYPGEGHGFSLMQNRLDFARRVEQFLATHLAPR